jgi:REP element-mobilizing transposase RayT
VVNEYRERQFQYFLDVDRLLDNTRQGPSWLRQPEVARVVADALHHGDGKDYELLAYCIMPNHVHIVFSLGEAVQDEMMCLDVNFTPFPVTRLMGSIKKYTGRLANRILHRSGSFWQHESYDHVIRDSVELERILWYVLNNPVAAGMTADWTEWKWTYCKRGLLF